MRNRSRHCLIIALTMLISSLCAADEKRLSHSALFDHVQNRTWEGELSIGGKVERFRLRTTVKRPCEMCSTMALHLAFDFDGTFEFPLELRTSDGGFDTVVRSATEIAILSGTQCIGPDVGPFHDEIGLGACRRKITDTDGVEYLLKLGVSHFSYYRRFDMARKSKPESLLPTKMTCDFTEANKRIQGGVTYGIAGMKHMVQFSLWEQ